MWDAHCAGPRGSKQGPVAATFALPISGCGKPESSRLGMACSHVETLPLDQFGWLRAFGGVGPLHVSLIHVSRSADIGCRAGFTQVHAKPSNYHPREGSFGETRLMSAYPASTSQNKSEHVWSAICSVVPTCSYEAHNYFLRSTCAGHIMGTEVGHASFNSACVGSLT